MFECKRMVKRVRLYLNSYHKPQTPKQLEKRIINEQKIIKKINFKIFI